MTDLKPIPQLDLHIEYAAIGDLIENDLNPRVHSKRQLNALARSIKQFGFVVPLLVDQNGRIVAGHGRLQAAAKLSLARVPVVRVEHLSEHELRALMIADNKLTDMSSWNEDLLADNFRILSVEGINLDLEATGFSMGEIDLILDPPATNPAEDPDDAPVEDGKGPPVNRVGDLWQCGSHRLICGNTLEPETWTRLMAGEKAAMSCSDVPYNVKISGNVSGLGKVRHGEFVMASGEMGRGEFTGFLEQAFRQMADHSVAGSLHYGFIDWRHLGEMQAAGDAVFTELKNVCVWDKGRGGMGNLYRSTHEFVFVWKAGKARQRNNVSLGEHGRNRTNIWRYPPIGTFRHSDEGDLLALHPTVKPVRMIADAILDVTARGDIVIDGFLGSGTSIIAAERVGRRCYGVELDPTYADTIIRRFERHSGEAAIHVETGKTFAEIAAERLPAVGEEDGDDE
jgi:hypothetical protein